MDPRDIAIRTIIGEAAGEGPDGWAAVANVLRNRAADPRWPSDIAQVALQPKQFSAWNEGAGGNSLVRKYGPGDPLYERVGSVVDSVFRSGADNTGGATHYYSPAGMQALVSEGSQSNTTPRWLEEETARRGGRTTQVGGHIFTGLANGEYTGDPLQAPMTHGPQGVFGDVYAQGGQGGFTQEQVAQAMQQGQGGQQPMQAPQAAPVEMAPMQPREGYQNPNDALAQAMQSLQALQQRRKGLLGWA